MKTTVGFAVLVAGILLGQGQASTAEPKDIHEFATLKFCVWVHIA